MKRMQNIAIIIGILCIVYFGAIRMMRNYGTNFYFIWLLAGIVLLAWGICMKYGILIPHLPIWVKRIFLLMVTMGGILFVFVEGCIISGFMAKAPENLDYVIVLGAQMKAGGPSRVLQMRLDTAYDYLVSNPNTQVIVSGGQGADEHVSEAQGMYDYLVGRGIAPERIILENRSRNTSQNINFSSVFLDKESHSVGIVSNNFHIFRATHIAKKSGYQQVYGIPAPAELSMQGNNMLREFFGVVKDFLVGNI